MTIFKSMLSALKGGNTVFGNITFEDPHALSDAFIVRAFVKTMANEEVLGEDAPVSVSYTISYPTARLNRTERKTATILVRVFDETGKKLVESEVRRNIKKKQRVDLVIASKQVARNPESGKVEQQVKPMRVSGTIKCLGVSGPLTVNAFDIDFRSRELLGQQILELDQSHYRIAYTADSFARAEKHRADILVSVHDKDGKTLSESEVFYNAPDILDGVDLVAEQQQIDEQPLQLTEYEALVTAIEPITEGISAKDFTDRDLEFLSEELQHRPSSVVTQEKLHLRSRLQFLSFADAWSAETDIAAEIFYAGLRQDLPAELDDFLSLPGERIRVAVRASVEAAIVPSEVLGLLDRALERRTTVRRVQGRESLEIVILRLVDAETDRPIGRATVVVNDLDGLDGPTPLGRETTDPRGLVRIRYPRSENTLPEERRNLQLTLLDRKGEAKTEVTVSVDPQNHRPIDIRFEQSASTSDRPIFAEIAGNDTADRLSALGITSSIVLAREPRAEFVTRVAETVDAIDADAIHHSMRTLDHAIHHLVVENRIAALQPPGEQPPDARPNPLNIAEFELVFDCTCKDCESALSPGAYLAQLLAWVLDYVRADDLPITLTLLQTQMHQPFGELPLSCAAVEDKIRQVFLAVVVLRGFTNIPPPDSGDGNPGNLVPVPPITADREGFAADYRTYRIAAYRAILGAYGLSWEDLRDARLANTDDRRETVATRLGVDPDDIDVVFFDIVGTETGISEDVLASVFGLPDTRTPFNEIPAPRLLVRQREHLSAVWRGLDLPEDDWGPDPVRPIIEPDVMTREMVRSPASSPAVISLFDARRAALDAERASLEALTPATAGPGPLVARTVGSDIAALREHLTDLSSEEDAEEALQAIETLGLTLDGLARLVDLADRFASVGSLTTAEVEDVVAILMRVHRRSLHADWIEEEVNAGIVFGSEDFVQRPEIESPPSTYLATSDEREAWDLALASRRRPATIDPAVLKAGEIRQIGDPERAETITDAIREATLDLHEARTEFRETRANALLTIRRAAGTALAALDDTLRESLLGGGVELIDNLAAEEASGLRISERLNALDLAASGFRLIRRLQERIEDGLSPSEADWAQLDSELLSLETRRLTARWRGEEREQGVFLHPQLFRLPDDDDPQALAPAEAARRQEIREALDARLRQDESLSETLAQAVDKAQEDTISLLRDALIAAAPLDIRSFDERVIWLQDQLKIDLRMGACAKTTRVAFAAETLARMARLVYGGEAGSQFDHVTIDRERYETEFTASLSSYQAFRSRAFAYLYPEAALGNSTPERLSQGFANLLFDLGSLSTQEQACRQAHVYSDYFNDVSNLSVEATCQALTAILDSDPCSANAIVTTHLCHMFARSRVSGLVYVSRFRPDAGDADTQTAWERIETLGPVLQIIGAIPHETPTSTRFIVLIVQANKDGAAQLQAVRFNLDTLYWHEPVPLALPPGAGGRFQAVAIQKSGRIGNAFTFGPGEAPEMPSFVLIQPDDGIFYLRALNADASDWGSDWFPLFGPDFTYTFTRPLAMAQRSPDSFVVFAEQEGGRVWYRVLFEGDPHEDTGTWMLYGRESIKGTLAWPTEDHHLYVFDGPSDQTHVSLFRQTDELQLDEIFPSRVNNEEWNVGEYQDRVRRLDRWLKSSCGVSLSSFKFEVFPPKFDNPKEFASNSSKEQAPLVFPGFSGTLLELLLLSGGLPNDFTALFGELPEEEWKDIGTRKEKKFVGAFSWRLLRAQFIYQGLLHFAKEIADIGKVSFVHERLGDWKLADWYIQIYLRESTESNDSARPRGLIEVLRNIVDPNIRQDLDSQHFLNAERLTYSIKGFFTLPVYPQISNLNRRGPFDVDDGEGDQIIPLGKLATTVRHYVPAGFTNLFGTTPHRHVVYRSPNGSFRIDYIGRNAQNQIQAVTPLRVTPEHDGPTDILPLAARNALHLRRQLVSKAYDQLSGSPPSILMYLIEAYRLVPLRIAGALQEAGAYDEAIAWLRLVYDFLAPRGEREIDYGLVLEQELDFTFDALDRWLDDADNVHAIAATRRNTWTRYVIISIAGCLIDQADALFATDAPEDLVRATELYQRALDLLEYFGHPLAICDQIIGRLEIDITEGIGLPSEDLRFALAHIHNPERLEVLADDLRAIAVDVNQPPRERLRLIRSRVSEAVAEEPVPVTIAERIDTAREALRQAEAIVLADPLTRETLTHVASSRFDKRRNTSTEIASLRANLAEHSGTDWLLTAPETLALNFAAEPSGNRNVILAELAPMYSLTIAEPPPRPLPVNGLTVSFCIPQNPLIEILRGRAQANLEKLRNCRNIAGFQRELDPYGGEIGIGAGIGRDGIVVSRIQEPNTDLRYAALRDRAFQLINEAEQVESRYQASLVAAEEADFRELQFRQQARLTQARTRLADLQINVATEQVGLARRQQAAAAFTARTYSAWIDAGSNQHERDLLKHYKEAEDAQIAANVARTSGAIAQSAANAVGTIANALSGGISFTKSAGLAVAATGVQAAYASVGLAAGVEGLNNARNIRAQTDIQQAGFMASQARQQQQWQLQKGQAEFESIIASKQITIAQSQLKVTKQERNIAALEQSNAQDLLEYLIGMDFTGELYRWMAGVLGRIYRGLLQQATAMARLAQARLEWEHPGISSGLIKTDYWTVTPSAIQSSGPEAASRLGLLGAERLKHDMYKLEQNAFENLKLQNEFILTIDLAQRAPIEFQVFRETGQMVFETPLAILEREFPGHYLCLIRSVSISIVALIPPTYCVRASLTFGGSSTVVVGGDTFRKVTLNARPERVAFTGSAESTGRAPLTAEEAALRGPFEGIGFAGLWLLEMQRAVNPFDFSSIATVLVQFELTSLFSFDYQRQLLETRDPRVEGEIAFGFRNQFPDAWYDLHNPDQTTQPMRVSFRTFSDSFPRNVNNPKIDNLVFYIVRADGETAEITDAELRFTPEGETGRFGGVFSTVDGRSSTRSGSGIGLIPILGRPVGGEWELVLPDDPNMENRPRTLLTEGRITDLLLVITFAGKEHEWQF